MDIKVIFKTLWRFKLIMLIAILMGSWLSYNASLDSITTYESRINIMLDTPNSDLVKVGLNPGESFSLGRTVQLAETYAYMATSEPVLRGLQEEGLLSGYSVSAALIGKKAPIIELIVVGDDSYQVMEVTDRVADNFINHIKTIQDSNNVQELNRILINKLGRPSSAKPLKSRKLETMLLMFMGPLMGGIFLSFIMENLFPKSLDAGKTSKGLKSDRNFSFWTPWKKRKKLNPFPSTVYVFNDKSTQNKDVTLSPNHWKLLRNIDGKRSVEDLIKLKQSSETKLFSMLMDLERLSLIQSDNKEQKVSKTNDKKEIEITTEPNRQGT